MAVGMFRVIPQQLLCRSAGGLKQLLIFFRVGKAEHGEAALTGSQKFPWTPKTQIMPRYLETVSLFEYYPEPFPCSFRQRLLIQEYAYSACRAASDASAQLVQLGQPHAFRMFDDH